MADTLQTLALIVLAQNFKGNIVRQANRQSVLAKMIPLRKGAGKNVAFVAENTGIVVENYAEGADAANFGSDSQDTALLNWAHYRANFHVSGLAQATAQGSLTPDGNLELWARNMANGASALAKTINGALYTGAGTGTLIAGLDVAIGSISNTYAGIDKGTKTYWQPSLFNSGGPASALTFAQVRSDLQAILIASGSRPDVAMVHPNVLAKMAALFDPLKQYQFSVVKDVTSAAGKFSLEGGIGGIHFDGCVFVEDVDATDGKIYYLNTEHVRLETLPMDLARIPGMSDEILQVMGDDGFGPLPFGFQLEMLAKTGDSDKAQMKSYLQLCVDRPNACGVRLNIA
jgi:hypothetical protein